MAQTHALAREESVLAAEDRTQQDDVRRVVTDLAQELVAIGRAADRLESIDRLKQQADPLPDDRLVVGDHYSYRTERISYQNWLIL
jgi:hypothetical protein